MTSTTAEERWSKLSAAYESLADDPTSFLTAKLTIDEKNKVITIDKTPYSIGNLSIELSKEILKLKPIIASIKNKTITSDAMTVSDVSDKIMLLISMVRRYPTMSLFRIDDSAVGMITDITFDVNKFDVTINYVEIPTKIDDTDELNEAAFPKTMTNKVSLIRREMSIADYSNPLTMAGHEKFYNTFSKLLRVTDYFNKKIIQLNSHGFTVIGEGKTLEEKIKKSQNRESFLFLESFMRPNLDDITVLICKQLTYGGKILPDFQIVIPEFYFYIGLVHGFSDFLDNYDPDESGLIAGLKQISKQIIELDALGCKLFAAGNGTDRILPSALSNFVDFKTPSVDIMKSLNSLHVFSEAFFTRFNTYFIRPILSYEKDGKLTTITNNRSSSVAAEIINVTPFKLKNGVADAISIYMLDSLLMADSYFPPGIVVVQPSDRVKNYGTIVDAIKDEAKHIGNVFISVGNMFVGIIESVTAEVPSTVQPPPPGGGPPPPGKGTTPGPGTKGTTPGGPPPPGKGTTPDPRRKDASPGPAPPKKVVPRRVPRDDSEGPTVIPATRPKRLVPVGVYRNLALLYASKVNDIKARMAVSEAKKNVEGYDEMQALKKELNALVAEIQKKLSEMSTLLAQLSSLDSEVKLDLRNEINKLHEVLTLTSGPTMIRPAMLHDVDIKDVYFDNNTQRAADVYYSFYRHLINGGKQQDLFGLKVRIEKDAIMTFNLAIFSDFQSSPFININLEGARTVHNDDAGIHFVDVCFPNESSNSIPIIYPEQALAVKRIVRASYTSDIPKKGHIILHGTATSKTNPKAESEHTVQYSLPDLTDVDENRLFGFHLPIDQVTGIMVLKANKTQSRMIYQLISLIVTAVY
jgi:hypothetical protein